MFTWECPGCGKELDVDARHCPQCGKQFDEEEEADSIIPAAGSAASLEPPPAPEPTPPPVAPKPPSPVPDPLAATQPITPSAWPAPPSPEPRSVTAVREQPGIEPIPELQPPPQPTGPPSAYVIQGKHLALAGVVLLVAMGGAVFLARPDLFQVTSPLHLEEVPLTDSVGFSTAAFGDLQVAGVRPLYTDDLKPKVRFVVINHGDTPQANLRIQAHLSPKNAPLDAPPLASFAIALGEELAPRESRDLEADLLALGTLAAFPPWKELRIELEVE